MYAKNYEMLADAIVIQAVKDYRGAKSQAVRNEVEDFLISDWFFCLTNADGHRLIRKLEREQNEKKKY